MKKIIGLVGETGSGKNAFCRLAREIIPEAVCLRFSDPLTQALEIFIEEIKKEDQQWLGITLRERFGKNVLAEAIKKKVKGLGEEWIIVDGIRVWEEFEMLKGLGAKIVYITADSKKRWQRIAGRGEKKDDIIPYEKFLELEKVETEILIPEMGKKADFRVENNGSKEELAKKIAELINRLK